MKLTLRPEWRLWPFVSFLGVLDIKTGVTIALLFALLNKVAGIYGLIAAFTGAGGTFAQLSMYIYSVLALLVFGWGFKAVKEEDPKNTSYFSHIFFVDHIVSTIWTVFFATLWWFHTPHDGRHIINSDAQQDIIRVAHTSGTAMTDEERVRAATTIWNAEKGVTLAIIVLSWLSKIYFALLLYSYASHLRTGHYHALARARGIPPLSAHTRDYNSLGEDEDDVEDFYRAPLRTPNSAGPATFADFINKPPHRSRKQHLQKPNGAPQPPGPEEDEVLFDEDELAYSHSSSSRTHSKGGTDESSNTSAEDNDRRPWSKVYP